jgi:lipoyl(octanoyl) transferase
MDVWRLIEDPPCDACWNMAADEALLRSFEGGQAPPTIRFYSWKVPAISLGRFQRIEGSIDQRFCESHGIPIVRRPTGGRAVLHGTDLTFSVVKPKCGQSVQESYQGLSKAVMRALTECGVPVESFGTASEPSRMRGVNNCFELQAPFEAALDGRKVLGCAQLRGQHGILQQNSLFLEPPASDNLDAFVNGAAWHGASCVADYVDRETLVHAICRAVEQAFRVSLKPSCMSEAEEMTARNLADTK